MLFNSLSKKYIQKNIPDTFFVDVRNCVTSTNTIMKEEALKNAEENSVLIAWAQTEGRGRLGRSFHSPKGTGIYMSLLLKPDKENNPLLITTDAAVAAALSFEKMLADSVGIKWVNDIYVKGKKVCGILAEGVGEYVVLGIGINVLNPKNGFPEEIENRAGSLFEKKKPYLREKVIVEFLNTFFEIYKNPDRDFVIGEYRRRSVVTGKEILVLKNGEEESAFAIEIDDDYSLVVKKETGEIVKLSSGDVSIKI